MPGAIWTRRPQRAGKPTIGLNGGSAASPACRAMSSKTFYTQPLIFPDEILPKPAKLISLPKVQAALIQEPQVSLFISERLSAFLNQPAGALLDPYKIGGRTLVEQLPYALAAALHDGEISLLVQSMSGALFACHSLVARGEHQDVDVLESIRRGVLCAFRPCITGLVDRGACLFVRSHDIAKLCSTLISSPARINALARRFVSESSCRQTRGAFEDHIRNLLPHAKTSDITTAWNSSIVPADWHAAGRPTKSHQ